MSFDPHHPTRHSLARRSVPCEASSSCSHCDAADATCDTRCDVAAPPTAPFAFAGTRNQTQRPTRPTGKQRTGSNE